MKNQDIYDGALRILAERCDAGLNEDYEERAPYIIAAFCYESSEADAAYRKSHYLPAAPSVSEVYLNLSDKFPCCERFSAAACMYLASMLVVDEDSELSDKLFDKYSEMMSSICSKIPAIVEPISDKYGF